MELAAYGPPAERVLAAYPEATVTEVDPNWEGRWREFHQAVQIGPLWVGPPWLSPSDDAIPIVIDPGRAFGTGAHPTSRLCLELLLAQERGSVLDVGCGSGVLSIAAAKLGFSPVTAIDVDEVAVDVAAANALANGVEIETRLHDARTGPLPPAELAVANVSFEVVESLAGGLRSRRVITAGYLVSDRPRLEGLEHLERRELDGWAADLFEAS